MTRYDRLITTVRIRPGATTAFADWKVQHDLAIASVAGHVGSDIVRAAAREHEEWTIIVSFESAEALAAWHTSTERKRLYLDGASVFVEGSLKETVAKGDEHDRSSTAEVTEVIISRIKGGREGEYRTWAARMQAEQAKSPGYRGTLFQPPETPGGVWTTIMRFESAAALETWMNSSRRKAMLDEARDIVEHEHLTRLATAFPGWVPADPATGKAPPNWKTSLLVLLGLFPIVMLEMRYFSPILSAMGLHASLATFVGNTVSVFATSYLTMPLFIRWFGWWLFPGTPNTATEVRGSLLLVLLFAAEVAAFWNLLPW